MIDTNGSTPPQSSLSFAFGPQPLGVFPPPASLLLLPPLPAAVGGQEALGALLCGDSEAELPPPWRFFAAAARGDLTGALALLEGSDEAAVVFDRFVLDPTPKRRDDLLPHLRAEPSELAVLLAVAEYVAGHSDRPPQAASPQSFSTPEVEATVAMARAAHALEGERRDEAMGELERGASCVRSRSPLFAAQLLAQLAELRREGEPEEAIPLYREALILADGAALPGFVAGLWLHFGTALHEAAQERRPYLIEAINAYQEALHRGVSVERDPEGFALAQNNLGLAYLALPTSEGGDALHRAVAVQSFREALKVYDRESHRELWASTQLNLANALQHLPSSHPVLVRVLHSTRSAKP